MFLLDAEGNLILHQNISTGIPDDLNALIISLALGDDKHLLYPEEISLHQKYPNPFNPLTTIGFYISNSANTTIKAYNVLGQVVDVILDENIQQGYHSIDWNASSQTSGFYFITVQSGKTIESKKVTLLK